MRVERVDWIDVTQERCDRAPVAPGNHRMVPEFISMRDGSVRIELFCQWCNASSGLIVEQALARQAGEPVVQTAPILAPPSIMFAANADPKDMSIGELVSAVVHGDAAAVDGTADVDVAEVVEAELEDEEEFEPRTSSSAFADVTGLRTHVKGADTYEPRMRRAEKQ